jgi:2C-methyl-D-erythritol 2,4-cyclodiphosphate synthase
MFSRKRNMEQILTNGNETPIAIINKVDFEVIAERINLDPYYEEMFKTISEDQQNYILRSYNNVSDTIDVILKVVKDESIS